MAPRAAPHALSVLVATCGSADHRKTLAAVRSLGRAGHRVTVSAEHFRGSPFRSRHCAARLRTPDPRLDLPAYEQALLEAVRGGPFDVLLPLDDYSTVAAASRRAELAEATALAVPDADALARAHDKRAAHELAVARGIPAPATRFPASLDEALEAAAALGYPCVAKPRRGAGGFGNRVLESPAALEAHWASLSRAPRGDGVYDAREILLQERLEGEVRDVCALFVRGEPRVALTQRRVRMWPPRGGIGIESETTDEPDLRARGVAVLRALRWHGPANVEFRVDPRDGEPRLLDVNGRFWGTLGLAIRAGIDVPGLVCRIALEGDVEPVADYRVGVRMRWVPPRGRVRDP